MAINDIKGLSDLAIRGLSQTNSRAGAGEPGETVETFGRLLTDALDSLNQVNDEANDAMVRLSAGESVELHDVMIAMEHADLSLRLALQVRNKVIEAYQEVQRLSV